MRFSVYLKNQSPDSAPAPHETSRSFGEWLVLIVEAHKVGQNAIQLTSAESWRAVKLRCKRMPHDAEPANTLRPMSYIPPGLAPAELPGCIFRPPDSDEWKLAHQNIERDLEMSFGTSDSCAANASLPIGDSPLLSPPISA
jgi:hypothetical protein